MPVEVKDLLPFWDRIKKLIVLETCKYQRTFYTYMKHYLSKHASCLLFSDLEVIERILDEFQDEFKATSKVLVKDGS